MEEMAESITHIVWRQRKWHNLRHLVERVSNTSSLHWGGQSVVESGPMRVATNAAGVIYSLNSPVLSIGLSSGMAYAATHRFSQKAFLM
jgi:hypothetical protein